MNISIAMATYNGEKYIREQLDSIMPQLSDGDELIISDDGSTDRTLLIIQEYMKKSKYIQLLDGPQQGLIKNFENALYHCHNDIIFFSDQDNIWEKNKKEVVVEFFQNNPNINLIIHGFQKLSDGQIYESTRKYQRGFILNMIRSTYYGFAMAFRKDYILKHLPFPKEVIAYDQWLGLCSEKDKTTGYIPESLALFREHPNTVSRKLSLIEKIKFRIDTIKCCLKTL